MDPKNKGHNNRVDVLEAIKSGTLKMRPRWHFIARGILMITGIVLLALALLYIVSFIFFVLRLSGLWFAPSFGLKGWFAFILSLPWLLIMVALLFLLMLELASRRFALVYRRPLLYSVVGRVFLGLAGGFILERLHIHDQLFSRARDTGLPVGGMLYRDFGMRHFRDVHEGEIVDVSNGLLRIEEPNGQSYVVQFTAQTRGLPYHMMTFTTSTFQLSSGDSVVIFGPEDGGIIQALGVQKIGPLPFRPRFPRVPGDF